MSEVAAAGGSGLTRHIEAHLAFADVWHTLLFLAVVWIVGKIFHKCGAPSLVGEILVGALAGPQGWDLVPNPTALMLFGEIGLILLVLEAGLDVDLQVLKAIGLRGLGVALVGSLAPLGIGIGLACGALGLGWQAGLTAGCTLAPTSMGIALRVLKTCKVLHTPSAQLIICAAIIDDVIALILLSQLQAIAAHRAGVLYLLQPILVSVTLVLGLGALGIVVVPRLMRCTISRLPESAQSMARMCALGAAAFGLIMLCDVAGSSHLLGGFLAGLCFCSDAEVRALWHHQVKRLLQWLIKLFFAATIGFEVPIRTFGDLEVVGHAAVFLIALLGKLATGVWAKPLSCVNALMVAFAMSAWGEFAFVIATAGRVARLIDSTTFSALILAVVVSICVSPVLLRLTILIKTRRDAWAAAQRAVAEPPTPVAVSVVAEELPPDQPTEAPARHGVVRHGRALGTEASAETNAVTPIEAAVRVASIEFAEPADAEPTPEAGLGWSPGWPSDIDTGPDFDATPDNATTRASALRSAQPLPSKQPPPKPHKLPPRSPRGAVRPEWKQMLDEPEGEEPPASQTSGKGGEGPGEEDAPAAAPPVWGDRGGGSPVSTEAAETSWVSSPIGAAGGGAELE